MNGANLNQADGDGKTPLFHAALIGNVKIAELLIKNGANVNIANIRGNSPLHEASDRGKYLIVYNL